jgi:predicted ATPase
MAALDQITIKGFKSIKLIEALPLNAVNVVIGPNGSGKSNFIEAFSFLRSVREGQLQGYVAAAGGADRLLHFGARTTSSLTIEIQFARTNRYEIELGPTQGDSLTPFHERAWFYGDRLHMWIKKQLSAEGNEAGISQPNQSEAIARHVRDWLASWRLYHFHDTSALSPMKRTGDLNDNAFLRADAGNLAAYLYLLKEKHPSEYGLIRGAVQRVAPFFDDFNLAPLRLNEDKIRLEWKHVGSDQYFDASSLSDGSLRFIALATLLLQPRQFQPSVILIDEPELGLHPSAVGILASLVKSACKGFSPSQVVLSTQSPQLLDYFEPDDVLVADRVDGGTTLSRLASGPLESWLAEYSLGQLWEKNELGGRPQPG